jgi:predicted dehydrogenase
MQFSSMIRVGLLGADSDTAQLLHAIQHSRQFQLVGFCELDAALPGTSDPVPRSALGGARPFDAWETLLDEQIVDAVIVARSSDDDRRAEQLRKLIQVGMPLLVSHPVADSMLVYYELDMIRRETGCLLLPYLTARLHPAIHHIIELTGRGAASPFGKIEQVTFERSVAEPTKVEVFRQFARDVDVIRAIAGDMTQLGAMAAGGDGGAYWGLGVQMSGPQDIVARWSVGSSRSSHGAHLVVRGSHGKAVVDLPSTQPWTLETTVDGATETKTYADWDPGVAMLAQLDAMLAGAPPLSANWVDAARSVELAETIDRSLLKGRTIELYYEDYTEEGTFKGTMTSLGCGLLLIGLVLLGAVGIGEQMGLTFVRAWPYLLLGVLGLFLAMQLLVVISRKQTLSKDPPRETPSPPELLASRPRPQKSNPIQP